MSWSLQMMKLKMLKLSKMINRSVLISSFHRQYAQTTIGWAGTPSGQNVGLTQPGNPAESGLLLTTGKYWIKSFMLKLWKLTTNLKILFWIRILCILRFWHLTTTGSEGSGTWHHWQLGCWHIWATPQSLAGHR